MKIKCHQLLWMFFLLWGCNENKQNTIIASDNTDFETADQHTAQNSLDWKGTYTGILPCADCEGIETKVVLRDSTYTLSSMYLGKEESASLEYFGDFNWSENGSTIILSGIENAPNQYKVQENSLAQLDMQGNPITGLHGKQYILTKFNHEICDKKWVLIELNGKTHDYPISILFQSLDSRVTGHSGCNPYTGEFSLKDTRLIFSKMASTMMACERMELESEYHKMLVAVSLFSIENDILALYNADKTVLAQFKQGE